MNEIVRALTGTDARPEVTLTRHYRASVADVRDACTSPERLARWCGILTGDPRAVGDQYELTFTDDEEGSAVGRVLRCDDDGFAVTWQWDDEADSVVDVRLTSVTDGTQFTLRHALGEREYLADYGGGWERILQLCGRAVGDVTAADRPAGTGTSAGSAASAATGSDAWRGMAEHPMDLERHIDAPLATVWAAFTSVDGLATWWWRHWADVVISADVRTGGTYRIVAPTAGIELEGSYLAVEPMRRLAFIWRWHDDDGMQRDEAVDISFRTADAPGAGSPAATVITVRHTGPWADDAPAESYRQGWTFTLGELAAVLGERRDESTTSAG